MNVYLRNGSYQAAFKNCSMPARDVSDIFREMLHRQDDADWGDTWAREASGVSVDGVELDAHVYALDGIAAIITRDKVMRFIYVSTQERSDAPSAVTIITPDAFRMVNRGAFTLKTRELSDVILSITGKVPDLKKGITLYWREIIFTTESGAEVRLCLD